MGSYAVGNGRDTVNAKVGKLLDHLRDPRINSGYDFSRHPGTKLFNNLVYHVRYYGVADKFVIQPLKPIKYVTSPTLNLFQGAHGQPAGHLVYYVFHQRLDVLKNKV